MEQLQFDAEPPRQRSSQEAHRERMEARALEAIGRALTRGASPPAILEALRLVGGDHCTVCGYKQKAATGEGRGSFDPDAVSEVAANRHRDGDGLDQAAGEQQIVSVLRALWRAGADGLTDEELTTDSGMFRLSVAARRADLLRAGWVRSLPLRKRRSANLRPMTVWGLTEAAVTRLRGWGWR